MSEVESGSGNGAGNGIGSGVDGGVNGGIGDGQAGMVDPDGGTGRLLLNEIRLGEKSAVVALPLAPPKEALEVLRRWLSSNDPGKGPAIARRSMQGMLKRLDDRPWFFAGLYRADELVDEDGEEVRLGCLKCSLGGRRTEMIPMVVECQCANGGGSLTAPYRPPSGEESRVDEEDEEAEEAEENEREREAREFHEKLKTACARYGIEVVGYEVLPPPKRPKAQQPPPPPPAEWYSLLVSWCPACKTWYWAALE